VPEFGYSGTSVNPVSTATRNPWDLDRTPGGSSSGSAAAVSVGMGPLTIGSDGGGSVRVPASLCGLYGIKPSMGRIPLYPGCRVPQHPGFSSWETLEHLGPLSRTVYDSALLLSAITGPDGRDRHSIPCADVDWLRSVAGQIAGSRVVYSEDFGYAAVDPEVRSLVRAAVDVFGGELGCSVDEANPGWSDPAEAFQALVIGSSDLVGMRAMADKLGEGMSPHLAAMLGSDWSAEQLSEGELVRKEVSVRMARLMSTYDFLLTPTVGTPAFELGPQLPDEIDGRPVGPFDLIAFALPFNMTGQPAASVPVGWTSHGLPVGLQIVGRHLADADVLRASAAFEQARPWSDRWPEI
jgi:aspartyl-tRNA(Asn)/glutamyl-tRNA(Gln) amidotransferase subunit A